MRKTVLFLLPILLLAACADSTQKPTDGSDAQTATHVTIFESKDSQKKWLLRADQVDFQDLSSAVLTNPHLLLREEGQDSAEVSGKKGTFNYNQKLVSIEGDAQVHSFKEDLLLTTDRFFYDVDKDLIWSDKKTVITRGNTEITAQGGIKTDSKLNQIEFKKQSTQLPSDLKELEGVKP